MPWIAEIKNYDFSLRFGICMVYSILVVGLLVKDHFTDSDWVGYILSLVMVAMLILFGVIAGMMGYKEKLGGDR